MDRPMRWIPVEEHVHVTRAVVLLRLARGAESGPRERGGADEDARVSEAVVLELVPGRGGAELEAWSLKKEAAYFREVFRRELFVEVA
jgi:exopolyphosphatase/guanosine-5'-triphosphate,3'-diphosphate pyrophosphatase